MLGSNNGSVWRKDSGVGYRLGRRIGRKPTVSGQRTVAIVALCVAFLLQLLGPFLGTVFSEPSEARQQIRCLVFVEGGKGQEDRVQALFEDVNKYLEREGVEAVLVPCGPFNPIEFTGDTARAMLGELRRSAAGSSEAWNLVVAFTNSPLRGPNGENWSGVMEKRLNRYIIVKCLNRNTLLHEIGHALGLPHGTGMMLPTLKTNYVHLDTDYRDALNKMTAVWSAASVRGGYMRAEATQERPRSLSPGSRRYAQAELQH